jgi:KDO2-lipid IV(A) lauroyltransferase
MLTTVTPARLAIRYGCELIPIRVQRLGGARFRVTFYPPIAPPENTADDQLKARAMTGEINALFEQWITEQPDEWLCTKRRWPIHAECA